ncbi:MAG: hypothetical protein DME19_01090 [Verrucomicrobia bacterium]|nr:MAG: hypothetical protein DME19_01090 [Verrucomicrobiota bacterium]
MNCTPATPTLSDALAEMVTDEPDTAALFAGAIRETVGAFVSSGGGPPSLSRIVIVTLFRAPTL